jgi:hypothetical protein
MAMSAFRLDQRYKLAYKNKLWFGETILPPSGLTLNIQLMAKDVPQVPVTCFKNQDTRSLCCLVSDTLGAYALVPWVIPREASMCLQGSHWWDAMAPQEGNLTMRMVS